MLPDPACDRLGRILHLCGSGAIPPNIALMRLLAEAEAPAQARHALEAAAAEAGPDPEKRRRLLELLELWEATPAAWEIVKGVLGTIDHTPRPISDTDALAKLAAAFDEAARFSPEGSVALYSLGDPELLRRASAEIAAVIREWGLTGKSRRCLDVGCGIGRMERALAGDFAAMVGIDISAEMLRSAQERCRDLRSVRFELGSGRDLAGLADRSFDLVLAVDSFPYLIQAGADLARGMVAEAARVLRPGGTVLIFNFSYRGDPGADAADATRFAKDAGLVLTKVPPPGFRYWDGLAFRMDKPA